MQYPLMKSLRIEGYRPFRELAMNFDDLQILVGANGTGKTSIFEFLRFLRDGMSSEIPPGIVPAYVGQQIFHTPGPESFKWSLDVDFQGESPVRYTGELAGPVGKTRVVSERVVESRSDVPLGESGIFLDIKDGSGFVRDHSSGNSLEQSIQLRRPHQLALQTMTSPSFPTVYNLREYIMEWKFFSSMNINTQTIRKSVPVEQNPALREDAGNLSSVIHYLMTEHAAVFMELQALLKSLMPGFLGLSVKARGGPGEVMAFWKEEGCDEEFSLADLSDGTLRLLIWLVLCLQPNLPSLICIDEPDLGLHPGMLPFVTDLFEKTANRTQIILATHDSYFLMQNDVGRIIVMRKRDGLIDYTRPRDSKIMLANLEDFGVEEIEKMHRTDALEILM